MDTITPQFFLSSLSHEIRTPLNGIVGYNQLLLHTKLNPTQKLYVNSLNQCCIQLTSLINDILDFSKLATGRMELRNECLSFSDIINEVNSILNFRLKEKEQKCRFILDKKLPEYVISDKNKIIQILVNLISNSIKFTPNKGRIIVTFSFLQNNKIQVSVEDNGVGIPENKQQNLFTPFYRAENIETEGSGLGLAICKKLVELLKGEIYVESEENTGSIFFFTFQYQSYTNYEEEIKKKIRILQNKYVLVLENTEDRFELTDILYDAKMIPISCSSEKECLYILEKSQTPFSAIITSENIYDSITKINQEIPIIYSYVTEKIGPYTSFIKKPYDKIRVSESLIKIIEKNSIESCVLNEEKIETIIDSGKDVRILIAEDVSYNSELLINMLNNMNYRNIDVAENGEIAIKKLEKEIENKNSYDILLLDLKMPKKSGFEVAQYIQENIPIVSRPKIAVLTASILDEDRIACKNLGVKYFIIKPINMVHLRNIMKKLCSMTEPEIEKLKV